MTKFLYSMFNFKLRMLENSRFKILLYLLILFLLVINFYNIQDSEAQDKSKSQQFQKKNRTDQSNKIFQYQTILAKLADLNKNSNLEYGKYLTKEEQQIRLEMMKKKYPIEWYEKMFGEFDIDSCNEPQYFMDYKCNQSKILPKLTEDQIISLLLNYDNLSLKFNSAEEVMSLATSILVLSNLTNWIEYKNEDFLPNNLTVQEIIQMIKNNLILKNYKTNFIYQTQIIQERFDNLFNNQIIK